MGDINDIGQKIKGKLQKMNGDFKKGTGDESGGAWEKIKGNVNETLADIKLGNSKTRLN